MGLIINQTGMIAGMLQWGMRQSAEVTNQLLSVERILEYEVLPKEIQPSTPKIPPKSWPSNGEVVFNDMSLRYFPEGQLVLKHLSFVMKPKEKVSCQKFCGNLLYIYFLIVGWCCWKNWSR